MDLGSGMSCGIVYYCIYFEILFIAKLYELYRQLTLRSQSLQLRFGYRIEISKEQIKRLNLEMNILYAALC